MAISLTGIMFVTAGIIAIFLHYIKKLHLYRAAANFPGPLALPIIGNTHNFLGDTLNILNKLNAFIEKYPSPFRLWLGNRLMFVLCDADQAQTVLLSKNANEKSDLYQFSTPWLGTGLITAPAAKAKVHRKLMAPTFNQGRLDSFIDIFNEQSMILTKQMGKELGKGEFDIFDYVSLCTLDIVCETAMGVSVNAQTGNDTEFVDAVKRMLEIILLRAFKPWLHPDFIFNLTKLGKEHRKYVEYLHGVTNDVIQKKRNALKKTEEMKTETAIPEQDTMKKAFLDLMMDLSNDGEKLTPEELREEVDTVILAANDTTATAGSFVLFIMANFPEVQEKVYEELCEIYGDEISSDKPIDKEDLNRMVYLERVIKETMRLFPPAHILPRTVTGDINIGDKTLPKGSSLALSVLMIHRLEKHWPDPFKFDPDRFLPEEVAKRHPYCYIPFSGGARACLAPKYALMSLKIFIAKIVRRYVLIKDNPVKLRDIKLKADFVTKPSKPLTIRIVERSIKPKHQSTINKMNT